MFSKTKLTVAIIMLLMVFQASWPQSARVGRFNQQLDAARRLISHSDDSLERIVNEMSRDTGLSEIQNAQINLIRSKLQIWDEMHLPSSDLMTLPGTNSFSGSLMKTAQNLITQSRPDEGISLIIKFLESVDKSSDTAIFARIYLTEAYRQKREYSKGISMLYEILLNDHISPKNRAFACNRMAALMNEKVPFDGNRIDSVRKYSGLCIELSEKYHLTEYLALSQNELGDIYRKMNMPDSALRLVSEAAKNFLSINKIPQTINTYLNLSHIYQQKGEMAESKNILLKALRLGNIEENRNLFMYVYGSLADLYSRSGDNNTAYKYLQVAYGLQSNFYNDRINQQINEMSARFDLQEKEAKIKEETQKNQTYRLQLKYLIAISLISIVLLIALYIFFRFKNKAYQKLVEQNLKAMKLEKQVENCLRNLSDYDILTKTGSEDRNAELALRLEKFLAEEKPYLWSNVSMDEFCKKLNTNRSYLSKLINDKYQVGFYDLLFEYRIRAAIEYLNNPQLRHLSIEGIGEMAGFKSNSNFYKRFKNSVGMTPHQFRELAQKIEKPLSKLASGII